MKTYHSNLALIPITEKPEDTRPNPAIPTGLIGITGLIEQAGFNDKVSLNCGNIISLSTGDDFVATYQTSLFFNLPNQSTARGLIGEFLYFADRSVR